MNKLTAEKCREIIDTLDLAHRIGMLSITGERHLMAYRIALPVLEQQESKRHVTLCEAVSEIRKLNEESGGYNFEALRAEQDNSEWISCSERMPNHEQEVIVHALSGFRYLSFFDENTGLFFGQKGSNKINFIEKALVTHWMPLPEPPCTTPQIDNDGWIDWKGGIRPVAGDVMVATICRNGACAPPEVAVYWDWGHNNSGLDIIAYRVIENDGRG